MYIRCLCTCRIMPIQCGVDPKLTHALTDKHTYRHSTLYISTDLYNTVRTVVCVSAYVAGILIAVAVGVAFGIFLGGGLLFIVWPQINRSVSACCI